MTVSRSAHGTYSRASLRMQVRFTESDELQAAFSKSLSVPRLSRYLSDTMNDKKRALEFYMWNTKMSQSFYPILQSWEVCFRNKMNIFLASRYGANWPYENAHFVRQLKHIDKARLEDARYRQERKRRVNPAPVGAIVADLSAGFWVSMLGKSYRLPFVWRTNIRIVFPNDIALTRGDAHSISAQVLDLRNRIAHHEPIYHLPLEQIHRDATRLCGAMCVGTLGYIREICTFNQARNTRP